MNNQASSTSLVSLRAHRRNSFALISLMSLVLALVNITLPSAFAQNANNLPGVVPPGVAGYTVTLENSWLAPNHGFYPVRVTVETNPPLATVDDEEFSIAIIQRNYNSNGEVFKASVVIPAGSKSGTTELYFSSARAGNNYESKILIEKGPYDGRYDRKDLLYADFSHQVTYGNQPSLLMVSSEFKQPSKRTWVTYKNTVKDRGTTGNGFTSTKPMPDFEELQSNFGQIGIGMPTAVTTGIKRVPSVVMDQTPTIHGISTKQLPEHWIGLSSVEQILISASDLKTVCASQERDRDNLERWVAAGGALIVSETGDEFEEADKLLPMLLGPERSVLADRIADEWKTPTRKVRDFQKLIPGARNRDYYYGNQEEWFEASEAITIQEQKGLLSSSKTVPTKAKFAVSNYLNGQIVAVSNDMSKWKQADWKLLHNTLAVNGKSISEHIGSRTGKEWYDSFRIPGVGDPPVKMFQVLISLFILLAGPVMLLILKKTQQMQYLFVAVPCLSAAVCFCLFSYAILVDGSKKWGRAQSVTTIDHRTNMSVTHARATYYSGGRPQPYASNMDTIALSGETESADTFITEFGDDAYQLSGGEIRPRSPHEMVTIRTQISRQRLELIESDSGGLPSLKNSLGGEVLAVAFRNKDGFYVIENLPDGQTAEAEKADANSARGSLSTIIRRHTYKSRERVAQVWNAVQDDGGWGDELSVADKLRSSGAQFLPSENSYVAILGEFPLVKEQIEDVEYKMQLHIVRGQW
jgi:hypothetical protein